MYHTTYLYAYFYMYNVVRKNMDDLKRHEATGVLHTLT